MSDFKQCCKKCWKVKATIAPQWCEDCHYPGIDEDYASFRAYREEGYGMYQAKLMVGWADPPEYDDE